jgi:hypothetical protein
MEVERGRVGRRIQELQELQDDPPREEFLECQAAIPKGSLQPWELDNDNE